MENSKPSYTIKKKGKSIKETINLLQMISISFFHRLVKMQQGRLLMEQILTISIHENQSKQSLYLKSINLSLEQ